MIVVVRSRKRSCSVGESKVGATQQTPMDPDAKPEKAYPADDVHNAGAN
jgi:hypothetical protein